MTNGSQALVPNIQTYVYSTTIFIYKVIPLNFGCCYLGTFHNYLVQCLQNHMSNAYNNFYLS